MMFFRKHKYRTPDLRTVALEGDFDILVGSRVEFEAGSFKSVGQSVDEFDFSNEEKFNLQWDSEPLE